MEHQVHARDLSFEEARLAFVRLGAAEVPADPVALKAVRNLLLRRYHETGSSPDVQKLALLISAYRVLQAGREEEPAWDPEIPRDWRVFGCDGAVLMPGSLVRCRSAQYGQVSRTAIATLRQGFRRPWAVLLHDGADYGHMLLIFARGRDVVPPLPIPVDGRGRNPMLDRFLPQRITAAVENVVPAS